MKIIKAIIQYIITIIIAIATILFLTINLTSSTILNESYIISKLEETNYYEKIYEDVKSNFENYISQSGLEEKVLENIVTKEKVKKDTQMIISNLYNGLEEKVNTQEIKNNLNKNIEESLKNNKQIEAQKNAINTLIEKICEEYTETISHYEYEKQINDIYKRGMKYIEIIKKATLVVIAIGIISIILIHIKKIYKALAGFGIWLTIDGLFFIIVNTFINTKIKIQTILILNEAVSNVIRNILEEILKNISNYGYVMLAIGLILITIPNLVHNKLKYGKKTYDKEN